VATAKTEKQLFSG